jgi:hypothetical protein
VFLACFQQDKCIENQQNFRLNTQKSNLLRFHLSGLCFGGHFTHGRCLWIKSNQLLFDLLILLPQNLVDWHLADNYCN